eukprot:c21455_g1_i1 orf=618-938(+)
MDASVVNGVAQQSFSGRLNEDSLADRARECLLVISQVDPVSGFPCNFGSQGDLASSASMDSFTFVSKDKDEEEKYRQNLISISFVEAANGALNEQIPPAQPRNETT